MLNTKIERNFMEIADQAPYKRIINVRLNNKKIFKMNGLIIVKKKEKGGQHIETVVAASNGAGFISFCKIHCSFRIRHFVYTWTQSAAAAYSHTILTLSHDDKEPFQKQFQ